MGSLHPWSEKEKASSGEHPPLDTDSADSDGSAIAWWEKVAQQRNERYRSEKIDNPLHVFRTSDKTCFDGKEIQGK
jgi:hypothetical protein